MKPYTPAERLPRLAVELVEAARAAGLSFRAIVANCFYGENPTFEGALDAAGLPYVVGLKPSSGIWAPADAVHSPEEGARELRWGGPDDTGHAAAADDLVPGDQPPPARIAATRPRSSVSTA